jgi:hypothetical protein
VGHPCRRVARSRRHGRQGQLIRAPLENGWYAPAHLEAIPDGIDLLVVGGPKASAPGLQLARYPALPHFAPKLTPDATVILDDVHRPGEQEIVERWEREHGRRFERRIGYDNLAASRAPNAFYT